MLQEINSKDLINSIISLKQDQRIFIPIEEDMARDLKFVFYKRQGLDNLFLSYMNNTVEQANQMNLETFVDRVARSQVEENEIIRHIGLTLLGTDIFDYLSDTSTPQTFTIDFERKIFIIHLINENAQDYAGGCNCGSCSIK